MTIGHKLYTGFSAVLCIAIIVGATAIRNLSCMGYEFVTLCRVKADSLYLAEDVNSFTTDVLGANRGMNLRGHRNQPEITQKLDEQIKTDSARVKKEANGFIPNASTEASAKVEFIVGKVNLGSEGHSRGFDQIGRAIGQTEQVTQTSAASAEESVVAEKEPSTHSETLKKIIGRLYSMIGSGQVYAMHLHRVLGSLHRSFASSLRFITSAKDAITHPARFRCYRASSTLAAKPPSENFDSFPMEESFRSF